MLLIMTFDSVTKWQKNKYVHSNNVFVGCLFFAALQEQGN